MKAQPISPSIVLNAYRNGIFPMANEEEGNKICWYTLNERCIIPIHRFHTPRSLLRTIRRGLFQVTINRDFEGVVRGCAEPRVESPGCWLSEQLIQTFILLHNYGAAQSVEVWHEEQLVGGLFGVNIGGFFSGESMFHRMTDASKVALWATNECLKHGGFRLFDVQLMTRHLRRFGATYIPRDEYESRLLSVLSLPAEFTLAPNVPTFPTD